jgi:hypothetical protein
MFDQFDAGRGEAFSEYVLGFGREPSRVHRSDIGHMHKACAPGDELSSVMDRRDDINVRRMQSGSVGIIEQKHVAFGDLTAEAADDRFAGFRRACEVMKKTDAAHEERAVSLIERHHKVVTFVGDRAPGHMLQRDDSFFNHAKQPMTDDRESNRIHRGGPYSFRAG